MLGAPAVPAAPPYARSLAPVREATTPAAPARPTPAAAPARPDTPSLGSLAGFLPPSFCFMFFSMVHHASRPRHRPPACHRSPLDARHSQGPADPLEPAARELGRTPCARGSPVSASTRESRRADDGSFSSVRRETTLVPEEPTRSHLSGRSVRNSTRVGVGDTQLLQAPLARPVFSYGHVDEGAGGGGVVMNGIAW